MNLANALEFLIALLKHFAMAPIKGTAVGVALEHGIDAETKKLLNQAKKPKASSNAPPAAYATRRG